MKNVIVAKYVFGFLAAAVSLFVLHVTRNYGYLPLYRKLAVVTSLDATIDSDATEPIESVEEKTTPAGNGTASPRFLLHNVDQGRLGNTLFHVASTLCIAIQNNLTLLLESGGNNLDVFDEMPGVVRVKSAKNMSLSPIQTHIQRIGCCCYDPSFNRLDPAFHHVAHGYFQSWRFVEPCKPQVLRAVAFSEPIRQQASEIVRGLRERFRGKTLVSVHVRMEDYVKNAANGYGWKYAEPAYYWRAMTYFRTRLGNVTTLFVVMASDSHWFKNNVSKGAPDVHFLARSASPAVDLEVLSGLDHFIMSVGTFGWWVAYKSKGTVVCCKDLFVPNSSYAKLFNNTVADYLHPSWVAL